MSDYVFESYERFHGKSEDVISTMEDCPQCGAKFVVTHYSDTFTLLMKETCKCVECDFGSNKVFYALS